MIVQYTIAARPWYVASRRFATQLAARMAWEDVQRRAKNESAEGAGVYRHGPSPPSSLHGCMLTVVTMSEQLAKQIDARMARKGGAEFELEARNAQALIARRARVVIELSAQGAPDGRYAIRRPGIGDHLNPDGTMSPTRRGQG